MADFNLDEVTVEKCVLKEIGECEVAIEEIESCVNATAKANDKETDAIQVTCDPKTRKDFYDRLWEHEMKVLGYLEECEAFIDKCQVTFAWRL